MRLENKDRFTHSVNTSPQSLRWSAFQPGNSESEKWEYISNRNVIISSICEVAVKYHLSVECLELAESFYEGLN